MALDYFYDGQLRAYLVQMLHMFDGFQYSVGVNADGSQKLRVVPITAATQNEQVATIIRNNSENTILTVPAMTCYIAGLEPAPSRRQVPNHVSTLSVHEREVNKITNKYTEERGKSYTVERFMPVPYDLTFQLDIWTSNQSQKHQLLEQILTLFNPGVDLQTSTNALDWTALATAELISVNWSSRSIPVGTTSTLDVASIMFRVPAWLNPPAKIQKLRVIEQIITNVSALDSVEIEKNRDFDGSAIDWARGEVFYTDIETPGDHGIIVEGNKITLEGANTQPLNGLNEPWNWLSLFELYAKYRPGVSQLRLKTNTNMDDHNSDVVGTITVDQNEPSVLYWHVDLNTLPQNTLPAINGVIDPLTTWVGNPHRPLPAPSIGDRYLLLNPIIQGTTWGGLEAYPDDIIEFGIDGKWSVVFSAHTETDDYTLVNKRTGKQLTWTDQKWIITLAGRYDPGMWRIAL